MEEHMEEHIEVGKDIGIRARLYTDNCRQPRTRIGAYTLVFSSLLHQLPTFTSRDSMN
jgi:hypothetical protein